MSARRQPKRRAMKKVRTREKRLIGIISDTHGLVRPEVAEAFSGVDLILHAGDIGTTEVMEELRSIAPIMAVRGNNDKGTWANAISETEVVQIGSVRIYMLHDLKGIDLNPAARGFQYTTDTPLLDHIGYSGSVSSCCPLACSLSFFPTYFQAPRRKNALASQS